MGIPTPRIVAPSRHSSLFNFIADYAICNFAMHIFLFCSELRSSFVLVPMGLGDLFAQLLRYFGCPSSVGVHYPLIYVDSIPPSKSVCAELKDNVSLFLLAYRLSNISCVLCVSVCVYPL